MTSLARQSFAFAFLPPLSLMRRRPTASLFLFALLLALTTFACLSYYRLSHFRLGKQEPRWSTSAILPNTSFTMTSSASFSLSKSLADKKRALLDRLDQPSSDEQSPFVIIMGNEAGDTDSLASSILLSHLLSITKGGNSSFPASTTFVPLAQLPRADLKLRAENELLLEVLHVDAADVLFLDDLPKQDKLLRSDIILGITDHPQLSTLWQPYEEFAKMVQIVVDHHSDAKAHPNAKIRVMKGAENGAIGSAVSVVVDLYKDADEMKNLPSQLADLGLAAILIDTDDLRPTPKGKATEIDREAAQILLKRSSLNTTARTDFIQAAVKSGGKTAAEAAGGLSAEDDEMSIESSGLESPKAVEAASAYYRILSALKSEVSRLGTLDLLRRDYKEQTVPLSQQGTSDVKAGFSSVPVGLSDWVHERHGNEQDRWDAYWATIRDWMKQRGLDVAVVGTSFREESSKEKKGVHKRELLLAYKQPTNATSLFPLVAKHLESDAYAAEMNNQANLTLSLDQPWKGSRRVEGTGKKERVMGLNKQDSWTGDESIKVAVWLQRNAGASRKVYLPAIVHALKMAAKGI